LHLSRDASFIKLDATNSNFSEATDSVQLSLNVTLGGKRVINLYLLNLQGGKLEILNEVLLKGDSRLPYFAFEEFQISIYSS